MNILLILATTAATAHATDSHYLDCISLIGADIEIGRVAAQQWAATGAGADAQHCLALADIAAGFPKLGAARLEEIALHRDAGDDLVRTRLFLQAANAWLKANELEFAEAAIINAFNLTPDAGELFLTAAKIHAARLRWQDTIEAVTDAEKADFVSAEGYILRGRAHYALGDYEAAAQDVVNALSIDPTNISALTLRGDVQQTGIAIDVFYSQPDVKE